MRNHQISMLTRAGACFTVLAAVALTAGSALAADSGHGIGMTSGGGSKGLTSTAVNYNSSKSNTGNVFFQDLTPSGQAALRSSCAKHGGQVVSNDKGQLGCQVNSLSESKNVSDGAAKGEATE